MGGEWICLGVVDLLGIISFFLLSLVVRKLVVGYLKDTNAGEWRVCENVLTYRYLGHPPLLFELLIMYPL